MSVEGDIVAAGDALFQDGTVLEVRVCLVGSHPPIWRLVEIDADLPLDLVHEVIQAVMGFEDYHLHQFLETNPNLQAQRDDGSEPRRWGPAFLADEDPFSHLQENHTSLGELLTRPGDVLFYEYDLGDSWLHKIELLQSRPRQQHDLPAFIMDGQRHGPLEDSGGIVSYEDILSVLQHPNDPQHAEIAAWVAEMNPCGTAFDPAQFSVRATNDALSALCTSEHFIARSVS